MKKPDGISCLNAFDTSLRNDWKNTKINSIKVKFSRDVVRHGCLDAYKTGVPSGIRYLEYHTNRHINI